jgi:hypothetical protein
VKLIHEKVTPSQKLCVKSRGVRDGLRRRT